MSEGEGHAELYEKLRRAKLKIRKNGMIKAMNKLGYNADGEKTSDGVSESSKSNDDKQLSSKK